MRVLVIDTALGACTIGLFDSDQAVAVRSEVMDRGHQERIGGLARQVMSGAGDIDRIGVTVGPGSFTGLRVGLAFAEGLGMALDRPVIGLSTLDALAKSVAAGGAVLAAVDARRGQIYAQMFLDDRAEGVAEAMVVAEAAKRLAHLAANGRVSVAGSGAPLLAEAAPHLALDLHPLPAPTPEALAQLTRTAPDPSGPVRPAYLRAPDAALPTRKPGQPRPPRGGAPS